MSDKKIDLIFVAGMIDKKLESKILPFQNSNLVGNIYLIRRNHYSGEKITCFSPPGFLKRSYALSEIYRIFSVFWLLINRKANILIAAGFMPHCIYTTFFRKLFRGRSILLLMGQTEIDLSFPPKTFFRKILVKIALASDYIGVRGEVSRSILITHGFNEKYIFIPHNVFNFKRYLPCKKDNPGIDLLYYGNFHKEKRLDILIDIVEVLVNKYNLQLSVVLAGHGYEYKNLRDSVKGKKLDKNVCFHPFANEAELNNLLDDTKIVVMTSESEGLPMTIVEAFSSGTPVIAFNSGDISDILIDNHNGYIVEFGDKDRYILCVVELLTNSLKYREMVQNCLKFRKEKEDEYSLQYITEIWNSVLQILI